MTRRFLFCCANFNHLKPETDWNDVPILRARALRVQTHRAVILKCSPRGETTFTPVAGGLRYANELVDLIHKDFPEFGIAVAGYPEPHKEAASPEADAANLKRKVDAGACVVITQLFYDNDDFLRFRDRCTQLGISVPLVPGILPVTNLAPIQRITALCGARLPSEMVDDLGRHDDADWQFQTGIDFAVRQVQGLIAAGVPGVHFYVLNQSRATSAVLSAIRPGR